jgi:aspartate-semialdehyde dehydrogenase
MARRTAEPATGRIAILGAASPAGAHLKAALAERAVPGERVELYGHSSEVAVLSEYDGEARLVQGPDALDAASCAAVFVCEPGHDEGGLAAAAHAGTLIVDMTASITGAALAGTAAAGARARVVAVPHPITGLLAALLAPVHRALGLTAASVFVARPASDFGEAGLEELREQTVHLLRFEATPTDVFGRQLAFNVIPEHLLPSGEDRASARVARECRALLGAPGLPVSISQALVPTFYGHGIAAHVTVARDGIEEARAAWRAAPGVTIAGEGEGEVGATLDAPEEPGVLVARADADDASSLRVWAIGSEAGVAAAACAVAAGEAAGVL